MKLLWRSYAAQRQRMTFPKRRCTSSRMSYSAATTPRNLPMPTPQRGEVWLADLGIAAKIRPALILNVPPYPQDRVLVTLVPHTTSLHGTRFEVAVSKKFLSPGAFDAQGLVTVASARLMRKMGDLHVS